MHQILLSLVVIICIAILSVFIDRIFVKKKKKDYFICIIYYRLLCPSIML